MEGKAKTQVDGMEASDMRRFCLAILMAATTCVDAAMSENDEFKQAIDLLPINAPEFG